MLELCVGVRAGVLEAREGGDSARHLCACAAGVSGQEVHLAACGAAREGPWHTRSSGQPPQESRCLLPTGMVLGWY